MNKRLSRREMTQKDDFVSGVERAVGWLEQNLRTVGMVIAGGVGVLIIGLGGMAWLNARGAAADRSLGEAMFMMRAPIISEGEPAVEGQPSFDTVAERDEALLAKLSEIISDHGMSRAAGTAAYLQGTTLMRIGRLDEARQKLAEYIDAHPSGDLTPRARRALAQLELQAGNSEAAVSGFQALLDQPDPVVPEDTVLMDLAAAQEAAGRLEEAAESYRRVMNEHPQSGLAGEASTEYSRLTANDGDSQTS